MLQPEKCAKCRKALTDDEIAVTKKLVNRGAEQFYCIDCLSAHFRVSPDDIREKIRWFRETGCTLFK